MESITGAQVDAAHEAALACLKAYEGYMAALHRVSRAFGVDGQGPRVVEPDERHLKGLNARVAKLREVLRAGREAYRSVEWELADQTPDVVELGPVKVSSWTEHCVCLVEWTLKWCRDWTQYYETEEDDRWSRHTFPLHHSVDGRVVRAALKQEIAGLRKSLTVGHRGYVKAESGLWRFEGSNLVLEEPLDKLRGMSRKLMRYFVRNQNAELTYHDLAEDVWDNEFTPWGTIRTGISEWRKAVRELKVKGVASRLEPLGKNAGYVFRC